MIRTASLALSLLAVTLLAFVIGTGMENVLGDAEARSLFVWALCGSGALYFLAVRQVLRAPAEFPLSLVILLAVALRLVTLAAPPFLSSDIYRYVWDGMVQAAGINPYLHVPADTALTALRDSAIFPHINRATTAPTIYPPAAQLVFAAVGIVKPSLLAIKLVMVAFEAVAIGCLLALLAQAGLPRSRVLIYAWNPLAVWEFAGNAHVDAVAIGLLALALLLRARGRDGWAGAALGFAVLVKFLPIAIGPALWRRGGAPRLLTGGIVTIAALYAGYALWDGAGWKVLGFLPGYGAEEGLISGTGIWPLAVLGSQLALPTWISKAYLAVVALGLAALALRMMQRQRPPQGTPADIIDLAGDASMLAVCLVLALTPHYAWYYAWLALAATIRPSRIAIWLGCAPLLLYAAPFASPLFWPGVIFIPALLLAWSEKRAVTPPILSAQGTS